MATSLMVLTHLFFVYKIHRIQPFQPKHLHVLIISLVVLGFVSLLPKAKNLTELLWLLPLKVLLICVMYCLPVIYFEVSAEVNQIFWRIWQKVKR